MLGCLCHPAPGIPGRKGQAPGDVVLVTRWGWETYHWRALAVLISGRAHAVSHETSCLASLSVWKQAMKPLSKQGLCDVLGHSGSLLPEATGVLLPVFPGFNPSSHPISLLVPLFARTASGIGLNSAGCRPAVRRGTAPVRAEGYQIGWSPISIPLRGPNARRSACASPALARRRASRVLCRGPRRLRRLGGLRGWL